MKFIYISQLSLNIIILFSLNALNNFIFPILSKAQSLPTGQEVKYNPISTAVPFLTITPDSRHAGMGDVGAATSPDANSQYLNPSKYVFTEEKFGLSMSYTPWLREYVNDINLAYLAGYYKIDKFQSIGSSLRYFSMGNILLNDQNGTALATVNPSEFALDFSYSRKLSDNFSGGIAFRYIRSDVSGGMGAVTYSPANAFAADVSFFYNKALNGTAHSKTISWGIDFSNIGSKISYDDGMTKQFLPANLRLGTTFTNDFDDFNSLGISLDLNKLLVPTPSKTITVDNNGSLVVLPDNSSNESVIDALFSSFTDAPGGLKEELQEITISTGMEYWYHHQFALRAGYFNEAQNKGNRKFFTTGAGVKLKVASIDFSYLIPVSRTSPLANTIRFTILFDGESLKKGFRL